MYNIQQCGGQKAQHLRLNYALHFLKEKIYLLELQNRPFFGGKHLNIYEKILFYQWLIIFFS